jgi:hypothetical protein
MRKVLAVWAAAFAIGYLGYRFLQALGQVGEDFIDSTIYDTETDPLGYGTGYPWYYREDD